MGEVSDHEDYKMDQGQNEDESGEGDNDRRKE